jgi:Ni/Fe-hydrogenase subunit HybB-like protein
MPEAFAVSLASLMFWLETACFVVPLFLIGRERDRRNPARLFVAGIMLMLGGALLRINGFLVGYETGDGFKYFPALPELMVTVGMFAVHVIGYIVITRRYPVLPREEAPATH